MPDNTMLADNVVPEARARITWGDEPAEIRVFLISKGMSATDADATLRNLIHERNIEIRKIGIRDVVIGGALVTIPFIFFYGMSNSSHSPRVSIRAGKLFAVIILGALYGLYKLIGGIYRLVRPTSEHGSIPDLEE